MVVLGSVAVNSHSRFGLILSEAEEEQEQEDKRSRVDSVVRCVSVIVLRRFEPRFSVRSNSAGLFHRAIVFTGLGQYASSWTISRIRQVAEWTSRGLVNSRTEQVANWTTRGLADATKRTKTKHAKSPVASASCPVTLLLTGPAVTQNSLSLL